MPYQWLEAISVVDYKIVRERNHGRSIDLFFGHIFLVRSVYPVPSYPCYRKGATCLRTALDQSFQYVHCGRDAAIPPHHGSRWSAVESLPVA
jgi:hypothetical protein